MGAVLIAADLSAVQGRVKPEHFLEPLHRSIFEKMMAANERFKTASPAVVFKLFNREEVKNWNKALNSPLSSYLARLAANTVYGAAGINKSITNLIEQWARVSIKREAEVVASAAASPGADAVELIREVTRALDDIAPGMKANGRGRWKLKSGLSSSKVTAFVC